MNPDVKKKWVEALKSGEYKKGYGALRDHTDRFCCLGVLCDLYRKETGFGEWLNHNIASDPLSFVIKNDILPINFDSEIAFLPKTVKDWAELDSINPLCENGLSISTVNDTTDTFMEIISEIEKF